jgi:hypothetical protein
MAKNWYFSDWYRYTKGEKFNFYSTEGDPNLSVYRVRTVPYRTVPCRTVAYRSVPYRPWRFPRGTVLVDRKAFRTFVTVFRDFCLKTRTLPRFKFYHFTV